MGANGPKTSGDRLQFADKDAERMARVLSLPRCGWQVKNIPANDPFEVRRIILETAGECRRDDAFLIYISCHGVIDGSSLVLLLDSTNISNLLATALSAHEIMDAMRRCRAQQKILIFDCCNAGQVARAIGAKSGDTAHILLRDVGITSDTFDIIFASDVLEPAFEPAELGGSFLSWAIEEALLRRFTQIDADGDRAVSVDDVMRWLEQSATEVNRRLQEPVPVPSRLGFGKGISWLTQPPGSWIIHEMEGLDGIPLVFAPISPIGDCAVALGKYHVTNRFYRYFAEQTGSRSPIGKQLKDGRWQGPWSPWDDPLFSDPDQPVVCVDLSMARSYCSWLANKALRSGIIHVALPFPAMWDVAAFGTIYPSRDPSTWLKLMPVIHHNTDAPAAVTSAKFRINQYGLVDMIGNVWEWCGDHEKDWMPFLSYLKDFRDFRFASLLLQDDDIYPNQRWLNNEGLRHRYQRTGPSIGGFVPRTKIQLRGGSFLDNINEVEPFFNVRDLKEGEQTAHCDVGFRIAALIEKDCVPRHVWEAQQACTTVS
jgi:formylglycine-generating enzyme required for sulfatase activity